MSKATARDRASQGHAGRQHPRGVVARGLEDGAALRRHRRCSTTSSGSSSSRSRWIHDAAEAHGLSVRLWDFLFYASFGFVVTSSVAIAGVLLVFCYLIVPSVAAMLYADASGRGWPSAGRWGRSCRRWACICRWRSTCRPARPSSAPSASCSILMAVVRPLFLRHSPTDLHQRDFHDVAHGH